MRGRQLLLVMLLQVANIIYAQESIRKYQVYFASAGFNLDEKDIQVLNDAIREMKGPGYCEIVLKAHTDTDADTKYNKELAEKRAASVKNYLLGQGIGANLILDYAFGELKPVATNTNEKGKALNRRVEVELHFYSIHSTDDLLTALRSNSAQVFSIRPDKENVISGKKGLKITIPANAIVDEKGNPVSGNVSVEVEELFTAADALTHKLSTTSNGRMLESGGMFSIKASKNGKELKLKDNMGLQVEIPAAYVKKDMQVFLPVTDSSGVITWVPESQPFELKPKVTVPLPYTKIDSAGIMKFKVSLNSMPAYSETYNYQAAKFPVKPLKPGRPAAFVPVSAKSEFNFFERLIYPASYVEGKVNAENEKRKSVADKQMAKYLNRLSRYEEAILLYRRDSAAFEKERLAEFRNWLNEREKEYLEIIRSIEMRRYNQAIDMYADYSGKGKLTSLDQTSTFLKMANPSKFHGKVLVRMYAALNAISILKPMSLIQALTWYGNRQSVICLLQKAELNNNLYRSSGTLNSFAQNMLDSTNGFGGMIKLAENDLIGKRMNAGLLNNYQVEMIYTSTINQFGTINCDRFSDVPPALMTNVTVDAPEKSVVAFYIPSRSAFLYANYNRWKRTYEASLPKGLGAKLLVISLNSEKGAMFGSKVIEAGSEKVESVNLLPRPLFAIRKEIESAGNPS